MINYNEFDLKQYPLFSAILKHYGLQEISDEQVWYVAKQDTEIPVFENILLDLTLEKIALYLRNKHPGIEVEAYVNCADSSLSVNYQKIDSLNELKWAIKEFESG